MMKKKNNVPKYIHYITNHVDDLFLHCLTIGIIGLYILIRGFKTIIVKSMFFREDVVLMLPDGMTVFDIRQLSVWCRYNI